jgi:hypothetical protein
VPFLIGVSALSILAVWYYPCDSFSSSSAPLISNNKDPISLRAWVHVVRLSASIMFTALSSHPPPPSPPPTQLDIFVVRATDECAMFNNYFYF